MRWPAWRPETSLQQRWLHDCIGSLEKNETSLLKTVFFTLQNRLKTVKQKDEWTSLKSTCFDVAVSYRT